ncbi:hypothetical protein [Flavobacterium sp. 25HG05S-40]|uniref:hypothetical protein n=1 Tax=Flavobacterium sp. 25HG05S-40 TaxID=3458682 RepID=UPI0040446F3E
MEKQPYEGADVTFTPSDSTRERKFKTKDKKTYPAKITQLNKGSVDLTVYGNGEMVFVKNIPHSSETEADRSKWDWPAERAN